MGCTHLRRRQVSLGDGQRRPPGGDQRLRSLEGGHQCICRVGLAQRLVEAGLGVIPRGTGIVDLLGRDISLRCQGQEPGERRLGEREVGAGALNLLGGDGRVRPLGGDRPTLRVARRLGDSQIRRDLRHGEPVGLGIQPEEQITLGDALVVGHGDGHDPSCDGGGDVHHVRRQHGVLGQGIVRGALKVQPPRPHRACHDHHGNEDAENRVLARIGGLGHALASKRHGRDSKANQAGERDIDERAHRYAFVDT